MVTITVGVQDDHLARLVGKPLTGLIELIWNAFDADADTVDVDVIRNEFDGIEAIQVRDHGHGMSAAEATLQLSTLGGSWKRSAGKTRTKNRSLHGSTGEGRWRALGIGGDKVTWESVTEVNGERELATVVMRRAALREIDVDGPVPTERSVGTTVTVSGISEDPKGLFTDAAFDKFAATFALFLTAYPGVRLTVAGRAIDPAALVDRREVVALALDSTYGGDAELVIVEWNREMERALYLCDKDGSVLADVKAGVHAPSLSFTAYLRWHGFRVHESVLGLAELDQMTIGPVLSAGREALRAYLKERAVEVRQSVLQEWKTERVYPFSEPPADATERAKQELFDIVAVTASQAVNASRDRTSRRLSLELLRTALESRPTELHRVLEHVLRLSPERLADLDALLGRASLTNLILASTKILNRLDFLAGLELLVFHADVKDKVKERSQLHRILAGECWLFGEEFALGVDDKGLREVLRVHLDILGRPELAEEDVRDVDGKRRIVDLMLWRAIPQSRQRKEHLVVELKRPSQVIGLPEISQIEQYALTVSKDDRFNKQVVDWDFFVIGARLDDFAQERANQKGLPSGQTFNNGKVRVWARNWSEVIEDCRHRLKFVQGQLDYEATEDGGLEYLRATYEKFLPEVLVGSPG